jgi:hypothetical protein
VAYQSDETGRDEIDVRPLRGPGGSGRSRRRVASGRGGGRTPKNWATLPRMAAPIAIKGAALEPGLPAAFVRRGSWAVARARSAPGGNAT